ncbi:MAG: hypothetical protein GY700_06595 [Propionibacteriaceae bacterium]|nr:hypothetical protein [Propionibacteriaceae bacterium]
MTDSPDLPDVDVKKIPFKKSAGAPPGVIESLTPEEQRKRFIEIALRRNESEEDIVRKLMDGKTADEHCFEPYAGRESAEKALNEILDGWADQYSKRAGSDTLKAKIEQTLFESARIAAKKGSSGNMIRAMQMVIDLHGIKATAKNNILVQQNNQSADQLEAGQHDADGIPLHQKLDVIFRVAKQLESETVDAESTEEEKDEAEDVPDSER